MHPKAYAIVEKESGKIEEKPEGMREIEQEMSNFDHSIDKGTDEALKAEPNKVFCRHSGWNFNSIVWWDGEKFNAEVWQYRSIVDRLTAATLEDLMELTNDKYGSE